jgi:hypothetical protein
MTVTLAPHMPQARDRSTLADWVGRAAFLLRPVHELLAILKGSTKLFADETTAPVLDAAQGVRRRTAHPTAHPRPSNRQIRNHIHTACQGAFFSSLL